MSVFFRSVCLIGIFQVAFSVHIYKLGYRVTPEPVVKAPDYDGIIFVSSQLLNDTAIPIQIRDALERASKVDAALDTEGALLEVNLAAGRMLYAPTGPISEYHDVRTFGEVSRKAMERALKAGFKAPLLCVHPDIKFPHAEIVSVLGCLDVLYTDLQYREACPDKCPKIHNLGVWTPEYSTTVDIVNNAVYLEDGRIVARDIAGGDPERMAPPKVEEYIRNVFPAGGNVNISVVSDPKELQKEYPLFYAVNKAASEVDRHAGRIIFLTYQSGTPAEETVFLVGKGVTYDTGGADVKTGGHMAGMSRDKAGAAAIAGFMKILSDASVGGIKVVAALALTRNSIGENSFVADEVIRARSGKRVRVVNTDAEGRMVLADVICKMKEIIEKEKSKDPTIISVATLTGHAKMTVGLGYNILMENAVAADTEDGKFLKLNGDKLGDPIEISTLHKEDFESYKGTAEGDDLVQAKQDNKGGRGHQGPAAFLIMASGLDKHGLGSQQPIKFFHLDIAASAGDLPKPPTGSPVLALANRFIIRMEDPVPNDWH